MHYDALVNENCIIITRWGSNVKMTYKVAGDDRINLTFPAGDTFFMYIRAHNPIGTSFNDLDFYVYDYTTHQYNLTVLHSPVTQTMFRGDVALEKKYTIYDDLNAPPVWNWFYSVHVYDYNGNRLNLPNNGFVYEMVRPTTTNPSVHNIHYTDFVDYITTNAEGTIYMARYPVGSTPPAHP